MFRDLKIPALDLRGTLWTSYPNYHTEPAAAHECFETAVPVSTIACVIDVD